VSILARTLHFLDPKPTTSIQVACGALRGEPVEEALVKSFVSKMAKVGRGAEERLCSSRFVSPELAMEFLLTMGNSKETRTILQLLG